MKQRRPNHVPRRPALSLVESVVACVIVAVMIVSALGAVGAAAWARLAQKDQSRGVALARHLLAEIVQSAYRDGGSNPGFGPEAGETRATFNDVDDYNNLQESSPTDRTATLLAGYTDWKRSTIVEYIDPATLAVSNADTGLKRIRVTVTSPTGRATTLAAFRSASGAFEKTLTTQITYIAWTGLTLQMGSDPNTRVVSGTVPLNLLP